MKETKLELEERQCKHPKCKLIFKVLTGSTQEFHSENCRHTYDPARRREFLGEIGFLPFGKKARG